MLWSFGGAGDGSDPRGGLIKVGDSLYGTTYEGGAGTVFELTPPASGQTSWNESVLWSFGGKVNGVYDGGLPVAPLVNVRGELYGTTSEIGAFGDGTVFELSPPASGQTSWSESVLWSFSGRFTGGDGGDPETELIGVGSSLYGTTRLGGTNPGPFGDGGGAVFELTPPALGQTAWNEKILWSFGGPGDGSLPEAGLFELDGHLYGTTQQGGANGFGVVFELTPPAPAQSQWVESVLWNFAAAGDGAYPFGRLIDVNGNLYGTTSEGGAYGVGTVFEITP